jgi:hypothetical protein
MADKPEVRPDTQALTKKRESSLREKHKGEMWDLLPTAIEKLRDFLSSNDPKRRMEALQMVIEQTMGKPKQAMELDVEGLGDAAAFFAALAKARDQLDSVEGEWHEIGEVDEGGTYVIDSSPKLPALESGVKFDDEEEDTDPS